jgi:hypothetical protein
MAPACAPAGAAGGTDGSCNAVAAIVGGTVFWGSGCSSLGLPGYMPDDKLHAVVLP